MATLRDMLRESTQIQHERLDKSLNLMRASLTREEYVELLQKMYGFHSPVEYLMNGRAEWNEPSLQLHSRFKIPQIRKDLLALGCEPEKIDRLPLCKKVPTLKSMDQLLGCLYVLEGSTLGGQVLKKHFQNLFEVGLESGCAYYSGYGSQTREMWMSFLEFLNVSESRKDFDSKKTVAAAVETFEAIHAWLIQ